MSCTVLVTGCTGLVGRGITRYLLAAGHTVLGTSRRKLRSRHARFAPVRYDLLDPDPAQALREALAEADAVIHNAAVLPVEGEAAPEREGALLEANILGTHRFLRAVSEAGKGRQVIYISGTAVLEAIGDDLCEDSPYAPRNGYLASKIAGEVLCRQFHLQGRLNAAILRIQAPYGYGGGNPAVIPRFMAAARRGEDLTLWGTGLRRQAFTFVEDVGHACGLCLAKAAEGTYNLDGGPSVTMLELAQLILELFPGTASKAVLFGKPDPQEGRTVPRCGDKARRELGFTAPHDLRSGLRKAKEVMERGEGTEFAEPEEARA